MNMRHNFSKMNMKHITTSMILLCALCACSSSDDDNKDMTKPTISSQGITASPINCQVYHPGDVIPLRYIFGDDQELGNYNIEVHGNFDHHSHSTESDSQEAECEEYKEVDDTNITRKAWVYNESFTIPEGQKSFTTSNNIEIPADIRRGDYHFMIRVTDKAAWQEIKAIAIKITD